MTVNIEETGAGILPEEIKAEQTAADLLNEVAEITGSAYELCCDVLLCDEDAIHELNKLHRGIDSVTDVLSFPNLDFDAPGAWPAELPDDLFDPDSGELMLGNIAVCKQKVLEQADLYVHSARREFAFLIAHSLLHLCGYDHIENADRLLMEETQERILKNQNLTRDIV